MSRRERDAALMDELRKLVCLAEFLNAEGAPREEVMLIADKAFDVARQVVGVRDAS
jgi:hypothetical protein